MSKTKYGLTTGLSFRQPRTIDEGPFDTVGEAFEEAHQLFQSADMDDIDIVTCEFSDGVEWWVVKDTVAACQFYELDGDEEDDE